MRAEWEQVARTGNERASVLSAIARKVQAEPILDSRPRSIIVEMIPPILRLKFTQLMADGPDNSGNGVATRLMDRMHIESEPRSAHADCEWKT